MSSNGTMSDPLERLGYRVTGAAERGEHAPIVEVPAGPVYREHNNDIGDWCPWSGVQRQDPDDPFCPARCRATAALDDDDEDEDEDDAEDDLELPDGVTLAQGTLPSEPAPEGHLHLVVQIDNTYEYYDAVTTYAVTTVPAPPAEGTDAYEDWTYECIHDPLTGVGHSDGDSWYDVTVLESSAPEVIPVEKTWDFGY